MAGKPSDWRRNTSVSTVDELPESTLAAIHGYLTEHAGIPGVLEAVSDVWVTTAVKKGGLLRKDKTVVTTVLLGPRWLVLVPHAAEMPARWNDVTAIRLCDLRVHDYETAAAARLQADTGVILTWQSGGPESSSYFVGLGTERAAEALRARLHHVAGTG